MGQIHFNQNEEIVKYTNDPVDTEGVCWALSMKWLSLAMQPGTIDQQQGRINQLRDWVPEVIELQREWHKLHLAIIAEGNIPPAGIILAEVQFFGARMNLEIDRRVENETLSVLNPDLGGLNVLVERLRQPGTGHMLILSYNDNKGHAMATRARSAGIGYHVWPEIFFFDPNVCEIDFNAEAMKTLLRGYVDQPNVRQLVTLRVKRTGT